jgi:hypothetical protein
MANTSISVNALDFDELKDSFKLFLQGQDRWKGYDFDGPNLSVLIDLLSYNSFMRAFYHNMVANESHLDSAQIRDSAVSRAKELNYTPRSFKSSVADINISVTTDDLSKSSVVIPKGTGFNARIDSRNYVFTTDQNYVATTSSVSGNTQTFTANGVLVYEGLYTQETFVYTGEEGKTFVLKNPRIDASSINVTVIEDDGATVISYKRAFSLFDIDETSKVFFVQATNNNQYEILFGDGIFGRKPKTNALISVEYRTSNGELANGARSFVAVGQIDNESNIKVTTNVPANSGSVQESLESIRFNAPRHFTTQERAVTTEDYESLMKINFPEIADVSAFGGETLSPPQYGKVYVSVVLNNIDSLPQGKKDEYYKFLKSRSMLSMDPVFIDPAIIYIDVTSTVKYNINLTSINYDDIRTLVLAKIDQYNSANLNGFNKEFRYSNFVAALDQAHESIVSNETEIRLIKEFLYSGAPSYTLDFSVPLRVPTSEKDHSIYSSPFRYNGGATFIADDGAGNINLVTGTGQDDKIVAAVGVIDYETGILQLTNLFSEVVNQNVKIYADSRSHNIPATNHGIIRIKPTDVKITVEQTRT